MTIVDPSELTALDAQVNGTQLTIGARAGDMAVYGALCSWQISEPTVKITLASFGNGGWFETPAPAIYLASGPAGTSYRATCTVPGGLSVTVTGVLRN